MVNESPSTYLPLCHPASLLLRQRFNPFVRSYSVSNLPILTAKSIVALAAAKSGFLIVASPSNHLALGSFRPDQPPNQYDMSPHRLLSFITVSGSCVSAFHRLQSLTQVRVFWRRSSEDRLSTYISQSAFALGLLLSNGEDYGKVPCDSGAGDEDVYDMIDLTARYHSSVSVFAADREQIR